MEEVLANYLVQASWLRWSMNAGTLETYINTANPKGKKPDKAFKRVKSNIKRINTARKKLSHPVALNASYVVTSVNTADIFKAAKLAMELGVDTIAFRPDTPLERQPDANIYVEEVVRQINQAKEEFESDIFKVFSNLVRQDDVKKMNDPELLCFYSNHTVYIDARGDVYPCCYTRYDSRYVLGNIMNQPFKKFWINKERQEHYKSLAQDLCPACGYGRINSALKPLYLGRTTSKDIWVESELLDLFI